MEARHRNQEEPSVEQTVPVVESPNILWVGAGSLFDRVCGEGAFDRLLDLGASLTVIDIRSKDQLLATKKEKAREEKEKETQEKVRKLLNNQRVTYFDVSRHDQRRKLYGATEDRKRLFTHCYVGNWPQAHLLSAVKYSSLCTGGDIIITKPLDLNIPLVDTIKQGVFPDIHDKILMDDHYRNKGSVRALHRKLPELQTKNGYGKLRQFRMWLVEQTTIEQEKRLEALECGVIWDLATHLISLVQLFFLQPPYVGLEAYCKGQPGKLQQIDIRVEKVHRTRYVDCDLSNPNAETLAVIEVAISFKYETYVGPNEAVIKGLLVVGKGASRGRQITGAVKQLDFYFELGHVTLNLENGTLEPQVDGFRASEPETGFFEPVVDLLSRSYRQTYAAWRDTTEPTPSPSPGLYDPGVSFTDSYDNVKLVQRIHDHASGKELLLGYPQGEPIRIILDRLVGNGVLDNEWLNPVKFGSSV